METLEDEVAARVALLSHARDAALKEDQTGVMLAEAAAVGTELDAVIARVEESAAHIGCEAAVETRLKEVRENVAAARRPYDEEIARVAKRNALERKEIADAEAKAAKERGLIS